MAFVTLSAIQAGAQDIAAPKASETSASEGAHIDPEAPVDAEAGFPADVMAAVCIPYVTIYSTRVQPGLAFHLGIGEHRVLLSAIGNFGPISGFTDQLSTEQLMINLTNGACVSLEEGRIEPIGKQFGLLNAEPLATNGSGLDAVAFEAKAHDEAGQALPRLGVSSEPLSIGASLWVLAPVSDEAGQSAAHGGTIAQMNAHVFAVLMTDEVDLRASAGAPVVDANGKVVGLLATTRSVGAARFAYVMPITRVTEAMGSILLEHEPPAAQ
ncbi:MAG: hypothetical protein MRY63_01565 [Neomegalonema sp.]|nr:hypothetical protein [Neomegalonema sp.]